MSDLPARLRSESICGLVPEVHEEAADALEARDREIAELREALERIARSGEEGTADQDAPDMWEACRTWACDALTNKETDDEG